MFVNEILYSLFTLYFIFKNAVLTLVYTDRCRSIPTLIINATTRRNVFYILQESFFCFYYIKATPNISYENPFT